MSGVEQLKEYVGLAAYAIEAIGVLVIVGGMIVATAWGARQWRTAGFGLAYRNYRQALGRSILLGLEFLIAGDIIRTVVVSHTITSVAVLALIVLIRTFLSMTLTVEVEGRWPWTQRAKPTAD